METPSSPLNTLHNVKEPIRELNSLKCDGITPFAPPETAMIGESTLSVQSSTQENDISDEKVESSLILENREKRHRVCWHVMRVAYGKEKEVSEYIASKGLEVFYPTKKIKVILKGKKPVAERKKSGEPHFIIKEVSLLPNIFFIRSSESIIEEYAFDNNDELLKYLRFYYYLHHAKAKDPLIIPEKQIQDLKIACYAPSGDVYLVPESVHNFESGLKVRVIKGPMKDLEGTVARWHGQQRIGIVIDNIGTIATAYVPLSALEIIN